MRIVTLIAGFLCVAAVLLDAFQTIILPRRATGRFRLTRIFYIVTWRPWVFFDQAASRPPQARILLQLLRTHVADFSARAVGRRHGRGLRAHLLCAWAARSTTPRKVPAFDPTST